MGAEAAAHCALEPLAARRTLRASNRSLWPGLATTAAAAASALAASAANMKKDACSSAAASTSAEASSTDAPTPPRARTCRRVGPPGCVVGQP